MEKYLKELPFWSRLSKNEKDAIAECAQIKRYKRGDLVYSKDQECLGLIKVLSGTVRTFMLSEEGREIVLYRIRRGEIDVLSAACVVNQIHFETQMIAQTDCELLIIPAVCLAKHKESNLTVRCFIFEKLGERFSDVMLVMQSMLFSRVDSRIARVLLDRTMKAGSGFVYLTHAQLAAEINSSREVVSRVLKELEKQSVITLERGKITVKDFSALRRLIRY